MSDMPTWLVFKIVSIETLIIFLINLQKIKPKKPLTKENLFKVFIRMTGSRAIMNFMQPCYVCIELKSEFDFLLILLI